MKLKVLHTVNVQSKRDCAQFTGEDFFLYANTEPRGPSALFLIDRTAVAAGSEEKSGERPSKYVILLYI